MKILRKMVSLDAVRFVRSCCQTEAKHLVQGFVSDTVVVKKLLGESVDEQKEFVKEDRMLYNLYHENVVSFKAICIFRNVKYYFRDQCKYPTASCFSFFCFLFLFTNSKQVGL